MRIVHPGAGDYADSRDVSNVRFNNLEPDPICFCSSEADVKTALGMSGVHGLRLRSGRHHHEGMCIAQKALVLDTSEMNTMTMADLGATLTVGPGAKLRDVYARLTSAKRVLPGGGCGDVCIGGLVQGGGWGLYSREYGMTCDPLIQFNIVKADGKCQKVRRDSPDQADRDLFWAVAGGGGGNFGIVTELVFELGFRPDNVWSIQITWDDPMMIEKVLTDWCANFDKADTKLTTFCRVTAADKEKPQKPTDVPVLISGWYLGSTEPQIRALLKKLLPNTYDDRNVTIKPQSPVEHVPPHYQPGPPEEAVRAFRAASGAVDELTAEESADLSDTCAKNARFPHKVSSCFPIDGFGKQAIDAIANFVRGSKKEEGARRYLSLHGMGGNIRNDDATKRSSFYWRDKPFMLQYQAWWTDPNPESAVFKNCMAWVSAFRDAMNGSDKRTPQYTEGSFINFPDRSLPVQSTDPKIALKELLRYYYGGNLEQLMKVKNAVDPLNQFAFEMGIPRT